MGKIRSKQIEIDGHVFDSQTEGEYYLFLKSQPDIERIELQPRFVLMEGFSVECGKCHGKGEQPSERTGKAIKCKRCKGLGVKDRQAWTYKPDFKVIYKGGKEDVIDVKGHANERFPLVRKMFEYTTGRELVVIKKEKGEWVRK